VYRAGRQRDPIFDDRPLRGSWLGKVSWCRACRSDECHSASMVYLFCCDCAPSSPAGRFPPSLGRRNLAALFYKQARRGHKRKSSL
jgi:hypothetical protein